MTFILMYIYQKLTDQKKYKSLPVKRFREHTRASSARVDKISASTRPICQEVNKRRAVKRGLVSAAALPLRHPLLDSLRVEYILTFTVS